MNENIVVDARGLSCPEPVLMVREALATAGTAPITVEVSSPTARGNVRNLLEQQGRTTKITETADGWRIEA